MSKHSALCIATLAAVAAAALGFPSATASAGSATRAVSSEPAIGASTYAPRLDGSVGRALSPQSRWTIASGGR